MKRPTTPRGVYGELGVLQRDEDKVQCHVCGVWRVSVGNHVPQAHGMSADDYRAEFGLNYSQTLCSLGLSRIKATLPQVHNAAIQPYIGKIHQIRHALAPRPKRLQHRLSLSQNPRPDQSIRKKAYWAAMPTEERSAKLRAARIKYWSGLSRSERACVVEELISNLNSKGWWARLTPEKRAEMSHDRSERRRLANQARSQATHCKRGHPFTGVNLYMSRDGQRHCRSCRAQRLVLRAAAGL